MDVSSNPKQAADSSDEFLGSAADYKNTQLSQTGKLKKLEKFLPRQAAEPSESHHYQIIY